MSDVSEYDNLIEAIHDSDVIEIADAGPGQEGIIRVVDGDTIIVGIGRKTLKKVAIHALRNPSAESDDVMLILNAEYAPAWNRRAKRIECEGISSNNNYKKEMSFSNLALRKTPKSHEGWKYRCWLSRTRGSDLSIDEFESEVDFCLLCCDRYPRNYYSWAHLLYIFTEFANLDQKNNIFNRMREWISSRPSDHSSLSFVQSLFESCIKNKDYNDNEVVSFLSDEVTSLQKLMSRRPGLEATWAHLRWVTMQFGNFKQSAVVGMLKDGFTQFKNSKPLQADDEMMQLEKQSERKWSSRYLRWVLSVVTVEGLSEDIRSEIERSINSHSETY